MLWGFNRVVKLSIFFVSDFGLFDNVFIVSKGINLQLLNDQG
jgi:hypothetical protein